jgi:hypothetical protein
MNVADNDGVDEIASVSVVSVIFAWVGLIGIVKYTDE